MLRRGSVPLARRHRIGGGTLERVKASGKLTSAMAPTHGHSPIGTNPATRPATRSRCAGRSPSGESRARACLRSRSSTFRSRRDEWLRDVKQGKVDILCAATVPTLTSAEAGVVFDPDLRGRHRRGLRKDAPTRLKDILSGRIPPTSPTWRANADQLLRQSTISVVTGTRAERWSPTV